MTVNYAHVVMNLLLMQLILEWLANFVETVKDLMNILNANVAVGTYGYRAANVGLFNEKSSFASPRTPLTPPTGVTQRNKSWTTTILANPLIVPVFGFGFFPS